MYSIEARGDHGSFPATRGVNSAVRALMRRHAETQPARRGRKRGCTQASNSRVAGTEARVECSACFCISFSIDVAGDGTAFYVGARLSSVATLWRIPAGRPAPTSLVASPDRVDGFCIFSPSTAFLHLCHCAGTGRGLPFCDLDGACSFPIYERVRSADLTASSESICRSRTVAVLYRWPGILLSDHGSAPGGAVLATKSVPLRG